MRSLFQKIDDWYKSGFDCAIATVLKTWGSSPCPVGSQMAVNEKLEFVGSVSGGCVESNVLESVNKVLKTETPVELKFHVTNDDAWEVGLSCGGTLELVVQPFKKENPVAAQTVSHVLEKRMCYLISSLPDYTLQSVFTQQKFTAVQADREPLIPAAEFTTNNPFFFNEQYFVLPLLPPKRLIVTGGGQLSIHLSNLALQTGFDVTIIEPRAIFSVKNRFPKQCTVFHAWPQDCIEKITADRSTAYVALAHDGKIDDPALSYFLQSEAFYVGALGSRKTHKNRVERLLETGLDAKLIDTIHAPIGLDINSRLPEEIAVSILAEIIKEWRR